jgi:ATP-dependent HslUV protease ATP-binding subunit HslU
MAIYLPGTAEDQPLSLEELTPREIVAELDKYVVGQAAAKRAVAVALRNRMRRQKLSDEMADEVMPRNILMIGSTGVGKTEIARRLAKLSGAPFLKVEASKFTEVGYVGRDVESMIRDLVENAIDMVREQKLGEIEDRAELAAEDRLIELIAAQRASMTASPAAEGTSETQLPSSSDAAEKPLAGITENDSHSAGAPDAAAHSPAHSTPDAAADAAPDTNVATGASEQPRWQTVNLGGGTSATFAAIPAAMAQSLFASAGTQQQTQPTAPQLSPEAREHLRHQLRDGLLDDESVDLDVRERSNGPQMEMMSNGAPDDSDSGGLRDMFQQMFSQRTRKRAMRVADAFEYLVQEEEGRLLDMEQITRTAIERTEDAGIIFLDEIDKIAGREGGHGPDISREGVQRDILPIVEGTTVSTKYGNVSTDHILFIAAGAFHVSKPSDLIPELQGRFPIRVELKSLTVEDFLRILTEPRASLIKQATSLLETEGLTLEFTDAALRTMAEFAFRVNEQTENIGARRLHTILEKVLDEVSFAAPELAKANSSDDKLPPVTERPATNAADNTPPERVVTITDEYVRTQVAEIVKSQDLSRYIL